MNEPHNNIRRRPPNNPPPGRSGNTSRPVSRQNPNMRMPDNSAERRRRPMTPAEEAEYRRRRAELMRQKELEARRAENNDSKEPKKKKKKKKKAGPIKIIFRTILILTLIICFAAAGGVAGAVIAIIKEAPDLQLIAIEPNVYTSIVYDQNGAEIDRFHGEENREYVTLDQIPENMQHAIVSIEDARFYTHNGIDLKGILRAVYTTVRRQGVEGASTITQQLIKNNITKVINNTVETKIQEQYLAVMYEKKLVEDLGSKQAAKNYILELYLNTIYLSHGYNGVQAAAIGYFNKDASELTLAESAVLAGITNAPTYYSPRLNPENNRVRQEKILKNMLEQGYITQSEYSEALAEDVYSKVSNNTQKMEQDGQNIHTYFVDSLFEQISSDLQEQYNMSAAQADNIIYNAGLQITSTLDQKIQKIVDDAYLDESLFPNVKYTIDAAYYISIEDTTTGKQEHSQYNEFVGSKEAAETFAANKRNEIESSLTSNQKIVADKLVCTVQPQSSMVIMDYHNGEVKALAGGRGEKVINRGFNRALDSARQPGSVFKVLAAFAPGIDTGVLTPATVIDDVPYEKGKYKPSNWYSGFRGLSTVREGIRDSMNIVAVKSMDMTGIEKCYEYLLNFGFTTLENDDHLSTALGGVTKGVTQLEVTAAYGTIANGGEYLRPMLYKQVLDHDGKVLLENKQEPKRVLKATTSYMVTDMMKDVVTAGTGTNARFKNSKMPVSGKTGTSQESRDLTFVGYTPYYVAGVWLGYDRYDDTVKNMSNLNQSIHLVLWRTIMEKVHEGLAVKDFTKPDGLVTASICMESGKLAGSLCSSDPRGSRVRTEYFEKGTAPTESCNVHRSISYCTVSNMPAGKFCPATVTKTQVGIVRPVPYTGSANIADKQYELHSAGSTCNVHTSESSAEETETTTDTEGNTENSSSGEGETHSTSEVPEVSGGEMVPNTPTVPETTTPPTTTAPTTTAPPPSDGPVMPDAPPSIDEPI